MYERFFGFREKPFSLQPDASFLYLGRQHTMALTMLQYGLASQAGITVVTGEIGSGKTTLIRHLLGNMDQMVKVGLITNTHRSFKELLRWILLAFDLEHRDKDQVELYQSFVDFLISEYAQNRRLVLIIDEAQNMGPSTLEELRLLTNINADKDQLLQLILVGQPELRDTLRRPELMQFNQRIAAGYHLGPLGKRETREYIWHRIEVAGGNSGIFEAEACDAVYLYSQGIPRVINTLCDTALVYAYGAQERTVGASVVEEVVRDKAESGLFQIDDSAPEFSGDTRTNPLSATLGGKKIVEEEIAAETSDAEARNSAQPSFESAGSGMRDSGVDIQGAIQELKTYLIKRQIAV